MINNLIFSANKINFQFILNLISIISVMILLLLLYNKRKDDIRIMIGKIIFENLKSAMIITDSEKKVIYANKSFEELTGFKLEEVLHKNPIFLNSGIHDEKFFGEMKKTINESGMWQGEIWDRKKNGEIFPKHLTIAAVERHGGKHVNYIGVYQDVTDIRKKEQLDRLEKYDLLTGLPNEKYLKEILEKEISFKKAIDEEQFLILFRITNYNEIVASYGYRIMDEVIVNMINRVELVFNGTGTLFRTGKEDFMVFGTIDLKTNNLNDIVEELNSVIKIGFSCDTQIVFINIVIGILPISDKHNNVSNIIEDINLSIDWAAKNNNGNYVYYSDNIREKLQKDMKVETLLRSAIDNMELELLYQPQIDPKTDEIIGIEALVRWNSRELGQVSPFLFIPIAEKIGIINDIGKWVMAEACKQNKMWQEKGLPITPISVNLSPLQFKNANIINEIEEILKECELEGKYLGIEITESTLAENIKEINKKLSSLKNMGISISIDDFGTGYSSLGYLRDLTFDFIKIDREFIKDYPEKDDGAIAKVILNLSRELGINSVAEGVETKEQLDFIKANGGNIIQGYYYSPPVPAEKIEELLVRKNESA